MNILFAGTPQFACPTLEALMAARYTIAGVLTQPDRPVGRGRKLTASPVKALALRQGLPVYTPTTGAEALTMVHGLRPDVIVVVAYGLILPPALLALPRHGCLNIHASLLPRWRGAAPIARAIEAGDTETGVTIMRLDEGLDTGPMLARATVPIGPDDTSERLTERLATLGPPVLLSVLDALRQGRPVTAVAQGTEGVSYARKLRKEEGWLDWNRAAAVLARQIRAFTPWPGSRTVMGGEVVKVCAARERPGRGACAGEVVAIDDEIVVATGEGLLALSVLQPANGRPQAAAAFRQGHRIEVGDRLG